MAARGYVKGQPYRFVVGHKPPPPIDDYRLEDRGYDTPCHIWTGRIDSVTGYGRLTVNGRHVIASRFVYERAHGPLPHWTKAPVDHLCRVPACVRLDHLQAVTTAENIRRGVSAALSLTQVEQIRDLCAQGWVQRDIAAAFGVSAQQVSKIKLGRRWASPGGVVHA